MSDLNVYQRKAELMRKLSVAGTGHNDHLKYNYISIRDLTSALQPAALVVGLDIQSEIVLDASGARMALITLTNVDKPDDKIVAQFACETPKDQGGSYIVKYALMKLFLVADDTDPDATMGQQDRRRESSVVPAPVVSNAPVNGSATERAKAAWATLKGSIYPTCPMHQDSMVVKQTPKLNDGNPFISCPQKLPNNEWCPTKPVFNLPTTVMAAILLGAKPTQELFAPVEEVDLEEVPF